MEWKYEEDILLQSIRKKNSKMRFEYYVTRHVQLISS